MGILSTVLNLDRYFETEEAAHIAARKESKVAPCGLFVRKSRGCDAYYISPLGHPGSVCYYNGRKEGEEFQESMS